MSTDEDSIRMIACNYESRYDNYNLGDDTISFVIYVNFYRREESKFLKLRLFDQKRNVIIYRDTSYDISDCTVFYDFTILFR